MQSLVGQHLAVVIVVLAHRGSHPPSRLVGHYLTYSDLTLYVAAKLADILESAIGEELHYLAIPFIVLGRVNLVFSGIYMFCEHPVGQARDHHNHDLLAQFGHCITSSLPQYYLLGSVGVDIA